MNKDKKIAIQQKIINTLKDENGILKKRNEELYAELEAEKSKPQQGFNTAKKMILESSERIKQYNKSIQELADAKAKYNEASKQMNELKAKYKKEMNKTLSSIKCGIKS